MRPIVIRRPFGKNTFIPACCIHFPIGEEKLLRQWVKEVEENPNAFTILMGDSCDNARTHYRNHVRSYRVDSNSQLSLDKMVRDEVLKLVEILDPIKDKIVGCILGNHYWEFSDGTNSEQFLAQMLGVPYLGPIGMARIDFVDDHDRIRHHINLWAHHSGIGKGALTLSGDMAAMLRNETAWDADIYVVGHTHKRYAVKETQITLASKGHPRVLERPKVFIRAGAFLKGFGEEREISTTKQHFPTYAETNAYRPLDLGWVTLDMDMTRSDQDIKIRYKVSY